MANMRAWPTSWALHHEFPLMIESAEELSFVEGIVISLLERLSALHADETMHMIHIALSSHHQFVGIQMQATPIARTAEYSVIKIIICEHLQWHDISIQSQMNTQSTSSSVDGQITCSCDLHEMRFSACYCGKFEFIVFLEEF